MSEEKIPLSQKLDPNFKFDVAKIYEGETILKCFQCGTCSASCPLTDFVEVKPHQLAKMILLGEKEAVLTCKTLWLCSTCFMCSQRCPQDVKLTEILFILKNMAIKEKFLPDVLKMIGRSLLETGLSVEVSEEQKKLRSSLGLPAVPPVNVEANRKLLKKSGFEKIVIGGG